MRLYDRAFLRRMRAAAREDLRRSPDLFAEYRRVGRQRSWLNTGSGVFGWHLFLLFLVLQTLTGKHEAEAGYFVVAYMAAAFALFDAASLRSSLRDSPEFILLSDWPIGDRDYAAYCFRAHVKKAWLPCVLCAVFYSAQALVNDAGAQGAVLGLCLGGLQGMGVSALGFLLLLAVPGLPLGFLGGLFMLAAWIAPFVFLYRPDNSPSALVFAGLISPAGWTNLAFRFGVLQQDPWPIVAVIPQMLLVWGMYAARGWFLRNYRMDEARRPVPTAEAYIDADLEGNLGPAPDAALPELEAQPLHERREQDRDRLRDERAAGQEDKVRAFDPRFCFSGETLGPLERAILGRLTVRECALVEFLAGGSVIWSFWFYFSLAMFVLGCAFLALIPPGWINFYTVSIPAALMTLGVFGPLGGSWAGLAPVPSGEKTIPRFAFYPVLFGDVVFTILKVNLMRALVWLPLLVGYLAVYRWRTGPSPIDGAVLGLKIVGVACAAQPTIVGLRLVAQASGQAQSVRISEILKMAPVLLLGAGTAGGCMATLVVGGYAAALGLAGMLACSLLGCGYCGLLFRYTTDLVRDAED